VVNGGHDKARSGGSCVMPRSSLTAGADRATSCVRVGEMAAGRAVAPVSGEEGADGRGRCGGRRTPAAGGRRCRALLTELRDADGRPLTAKLESTGQTPAEHLAGVYFVVGDERRCRADDATTAFTVPGSRVVHVCVDRFAERFAVKTRDGELLILHELLHTLGLRENPPSSARSAPSCASVAVPDAACAREDARLKAQTPAGLTPRLRAPPATVVRFRYYLCRDEAVARHP
jgi:hypothetical protein